MTYCTLEVSKVSARNDKVNISIYREVSDWRKEAESARSEADQLREEKDRIKKELEEKIRNLNESHQEEWRKEKKRTTVGTPFYTRFSLVGCNGPKTFFYIHHF